VEIFQMSDETTEQEAPEAVDEAPEAEAAVATEEAPADDAPAEEAAEPVAEVEEVVVEEEIVEEGTPAEEYEAEDAAAKGPRAKEGLATLYLCERGHRTLSIWSDPPSTCHAPISANAECGRPVYHSTELPEQVQKALNPLKASKKSSKG
jgi:hypothetical protein